jgi:hypothetical protein
MKIRQLFQTFIVVGITSMHICLMYNCTAVGMVQN